MGVRLPEIIHYARAITRQKSHYITRANLSQSQTTQVPKGHLAVYVGEAHNRFVVPINYLKHPLFQDLLKKAEEEFGYTHPMGGITLPCSEDDFFGVTSHLHGYS